MLVGKICNKASIPHSKPRFFCECVINVKFDATDSPNSILETDLIPKFYIL